MKKTIAAAMISASMLSACAVAPAPDEGVPAGNTPVLAGRTFAWQNAPKADAMPRIAFSADGRVSGTSGCNRLLGTFTLEGKRLDLSKLGMTRMMCSPESMKTEAAFTGMLAQVRFATESEKGLTLWNEAGAEIVTLTEVPGGI